MIMLLIMIIITLCSRNELWKTKKTVEIVTSERFPPI